MQQAGYLAVALLAAGCALSGQERAGLQGTVVNGLTGEPLAKVQVHVTKRGPNGLTATYGALTDDSGRFSVAPIGPGTYYLRPERAGYLLSASVPKVEIKPEQQVMNYRLEMSPRAIVSGRVTGDAGDPLSGVAIRAESVAGNDLLLSFLSAGRGSTDDRGNYRIAVPPGKYRIRADVESLPSDEPDEIRTDGTSAAVFPTTWFPQARSAAEASAVEAVAGREAGGADVRMKRPVVLAISGTVSGIPGGAGASVTFNALVRRGNIVYDIETGPDGTFSRTGLPPGTYHLYAETKAPSLRSAVAEIELSDGPIAGLDLALHPVAPLAGTLEAPPGMDAGSLRVRIEPLTDSHLGPHSAPVGADGAFEIKSVEPKRYQVSVRPLPGDAYLKSVRLGGSPAPYGLLDLRNGVGSEALKIVVGRGAARIGGAIQGKSVVGWDRTARVVLLAEGIDLFDGPRSIAEGADPQGGNRDIAPNPDGSFSFKNVPPGRYRLFAYDIAGPGALQSTEAFRAAVAHVEAIEIGEGDRLTKDLKLLASEGADAAK
ncbi:MAG TPA: carboxypeptidase regulatory-like domain-containing protein [Bryobacteraceae bacterium]|nr:carboxypeptidase regulatory-like domain-containing protein [Bryobacteraceae bacterium]